MMTSIVISVAMTAVGIGLGWIISGSVPVGVLAYVFFLAVLMVLGPRVRS